MRDKVELRIGALRIDGFLSYRIEADLYTAADSFYLELANPETPIATGRQCELYINGTRELTGVVDKVMPSYDKTGVRLSVEGRDFGGLLVDSYCEEFITVQGMTLSGLAERLLKNVPFINRKAITYQEDIRGNLKRKKGKKGGTSFLGILDAGSPQSFAHIQPGQTIFEVLKTFAMSRGMMFFAMPDGSFVFGKPKDGGEPRFFLTTSRKHPQGNNVLHAVMTDDISRRYSKIIVAGQQQGTDSTEASAVNTKATVTDPTSPSTSPTWPRTTTTPAPRSCTPKCSSNGRRPPGSAWSTRCRATARTGRTGPSTRYAG